MNAAGKLLLTALVVGGIALGVSAAANAGVFSGGKKKPSGNDIDPTFDPFDPGNDPGGGGGGGGGGGSGGGGGGGGGSGGELGPGGFRTFGGDPQGGLIFGHISDANAQNAAQWNPNGNTVRFSSDCSIVLVGRQVLTMGEEFDTGHGETRYSACVEYKDVKACWRHGQNLCCRIDSLMNTDGLTSAAAIGEKLLREMEPPCIDAPFSSWPPAMQNFVNWLRTYVNEYVQGSGGQADW